MKSIWRQSIRRSWLTFLVVGILATLSFVQLSLFYYFKLAQTQVNSLFEAGYIIGIVGFLGSMLGVLFTSAGQFTSEMGSLETLGFRRRRYIFFYLGQYMAVSASAFLVGAIIFVVLYSTGSFEALPAGSLTMLLLLTFLGLTFFFFSSIILILFLRSRPAPLLLVKEK